MSAKVAVNEQLHDVIEAAAYLHCSRSMVYQLADERRINHIRIGGRSKRGKLLFRREHLDAFLAENTVTEE